MKNITIFLENISIWHYLFCKKSIMNIDGFPTTIGSFWVEPHTAATMVPEPEVMQPKNFNEWIKIFFIENPVKGNLATLADQSYDQLRHGW